MKVCAITNVYNEAFNLPIWLRYYAQQVGIENCVVVDHGSNDGSTADLRGAGRIFMPREKFSESTRARFLSEFSSSMLRLYDAVIYTDCDEILVPDPARHNGLVDFCRKMTTPCATALGLNLIQNIQLERLIEPTNPILRQRSFAQFVSPMCKSLVIKAPVVWSEGFHSSNLPPSFSDLYLFHLRWVDIVQCLTRLNTTQTVEFEGGGPTHHHSSLSQFIENFQHLAKRPVKADFDMRPCLESVAKLLKANASGQFVFDGDWRSMELFLVPERFRDAF